MLQKYDFTTDIEDADPPDSGAPEGMNDIPVIGATTKFTIADNTGATSVTGLVFSKTLYRAFFVTYCIYRSAAGGSTRAQAGTLMCVTDGTNWEITDHSVSVPAADDAGVDFTITSAGQVQVASDANGGSYSADNSWLKWELLQLIGA